MSLHKLFLGKVTLILLVLAMCVFIAPAFAEEPSPSEKVETAREENAKSSGRWFTEPLGLFDGRKIGWDNLNLRWQDGLLFSSPKLTMFWSAWLMFDLAMMIPEQKVKRAYPDADGFESYPRRFRVFVDGSFYERFELRFMIDVSGQTGEQVELWTGIKDLERGGYLRIGYLKAPFSLEQLTSSRHLTFMERSLANALSPSRDWGIRAHTPLWDERMTLSVGIFTDGQTWTDAYDDWSSMDLTARLTGLPICEQDGSHLMHLGFSFSFKDARNQVISISSRPEVGITDVRLVQTGDVEADSGLVLGLEAAWVNGPLSLQGELLRSWVVGGPSPVAFTGFYTYVSYFLAGEHRPYQRSSGAFGRVLPRNNFDPSKEYWGAVEVAARVSYLNLSQGDVEGGTELNFTLGVNWYLDRHLRFMFNLTHAMVHDQPNLDYEYST